MYKFIILIVLFYFSTVESRSFKLCEYNSTDTGCQSGPTCTEIIGGLCAIRPDCSLPPKAVCFVNVIGPNEKVVISLYGNCGDDSSLFTFSQQLNECAVHNVVGKNYIAKVTVASSSSSNSINYSYVVIMALSLCFL